LKVEKTPAARKRARRCSVWPRACAAGDAAGEAFAGLKGFLQAAAIQAGGHRHASVGKPVKGHLALAAASDAGQLG